MTTTISQPAVHFDTFACCDACAVYLACGDDSALDYDDIAQIEHAAGVIADDYGTAILAVAELAYAGTYECHFCTQPHFGDHFAATVQF